MKKTIITILLSAAFPVLAQVSVTPPTSPTLTNPAVTISNNAQTALANATTNRVFIDQSGENPNVNITQTGTGNTVGADATYTKVITGIPQRLSNPSSRAFTLNSPVYLRGADQVITVIQTGVNNTIGLRAENPTTSGDGVNVLIQQIGDNNFVDAACGGGTSSTGAALSNGCKDATINWKFTGNSNVLQYRGSGDNLNSQVTVQGNSNEFYVDAIGNNHSQILKVIGDTNVFNISQTSSTGNGSAVLVDLTGSSNRFTISQAGTQENVVNIKSVANTGVWNINQRTTP